MSNQCFQLLFCGFRVSVIRGIYIYICYTFPDWNFYEMSLSISCLIQLTWVQPLRIFHGFSLYNTFSLSFPIKFFVFLIKCVTSIVVSCVFSQFYSLYILNGKLNPLIFMLLLKKVASIYTFAFYLLCLTYFLFSCSPLPAFLCIRWIFLHILVSLMTSTIFLFSIMIIDKL